MPRAKGNKFQSRGQWSEETLQEAVPAPLNMRLKQGVNIHTSQEHINEQDIK
jgi:hypothetical protein